MEVQVGAMRNQVKMERTFSALLIFAHKLELRQTGKRAADAKPKQYGKTCACSVQCSAQPSCICFAQLLTSHLEIGLQEMDIKLKLSGAVLCNVALTTRLTRVLYHLIWRCPDTG